MPIQLACRLGHLNAHSGFPVKLRRRVTTSCAKTTQSTVDKSLFVKLSLAKSTDRLDLSDCGLSEIPEEVFELEELKELSLSGNFITKIPEAIGNLHSLERFVIAGNLLTSIPPSLCSLTSLKGFWCHGNFLEALPTDFGDLVSLERCSLSGNRIKQLPESIENLESLELLEVAGNLLTDLPDSLGGLKRLKKLVLHGNGISKLPEGLRGCEGLESLMVQGNSITKIDAESSLPSTLKQLNVADNVLESVEGGVGHLEHLQDLCAYGNKLQGLSLGVFDLPELKYVWLEGNPLAPDFVNSILQRKEWSEGFRKIGLDHGQCNNVNGHSKVVSITDVCGNGRGYFKLARSSTSSRVVVVAFGSAPGEPNWAGLLSKVRKEVAVNLEMELDFDVLYVVDPAREWYGIGNDKTFQYYWDALESVVRSYDHCVMLGDSMGASTALAFAPLATSVLAFCPQVDLSVSSIRPSFEPEWWDEFQDRVQGGVQESNAQILIFSGGWDHDIDQVKKLDQDKIKWKVFGVDSHRLALYLNRSGKLAPVVTEAILHEVGLNSGNVRLANLV